MRALYAWIPILFVLSSCVRKVEADGDTNGRIENPGTRYATRFSFTDVGDCQLLRVFNPWQNSEGMTFTYLLGGRNDLVPDSLREFPFIKVPVRRVVTMSTTHVAMISHLGMEGSIQGASGTAYIYNSEIRERDDAGLLREVGYNQGLNYEAIVALDPDVVFFYGVEGNVTTAAEKLKEMGIQVVYCAEYLENHPLGKAEWIRFFSRFYDLGEEADLLFDAVDSSYNSLLNATSELEKKPSVMIGLPWKDTWYVSGGRSFASRLIGDAGGDYLWKDDASSEAIPLDLESVYSRAVNADVWINPGVAGSLEELVRFDSRFAMLTVMEKGHVFNNNARMSPGGGNDYWESGTVRPDLILADLISIFHPGLLTDHTMFYYKKLK